MPRKKQIVQRKRRQKVYDPNSMSGEATHIKKSGVFKLFSNYQLFAIIGAIAVIGGLAFSAFFQSTNSGGSSQTSIRGEGVTRRTPAAGTTPSAGTPEAAGRQYSGPPPLSIDGAKTYVATIKTAKGDIKVELLDEEAPEAVNNFVFLARDGFYDGVTFHRVIKDFVAQAGDPTGTGLGGPGYEINVEETDEPFGAGVLAMAKPEQAGAKNNGSQFFFTLTDQYASSLEGEFTAFGRVTEGLDVLQALSERDPDRNPDVEPGERIESIEIEES
jgi:cyclophilin family peptidyl-prolyl cis-trans isomerase